MALPPKGDPRRPLHLAVSSMRVLTILFFLSALCMVPVMIIPRQMGPGRFIVAAIVGIVSLGPGAANLVFSIYLKKYHYWAVVASIVLASLEAAYTTAMAIFATFGAVTRKDTYIPVIVAWFVVAALVQLIVHLAQSFTAVKLGPLEQPRGFEVLGIIPVQPPAQAADTNRPPV